MYMKSFVNNHWVVYTKGLKYQHWNSAIRLSEIWIMMCHKSDIKPILNKPFQHYARSANWWISAHFLNPKRHLHIICKQVGKHSDQSWKLLVEWTFTCLGFPGVYDANIAGKNANIKMQIRFVFFIETSYTRSNNLEYIFIRQIEF
jgi:hypothetical protein